MDGGVLSVPSDRLPEFYAKCVECIRAHEPIFVVEQKTDVYNFFVDIDYKDTEPLTVEGIKTMVRIIYDKVATFGATECLVSIARPKPVGAGKIKSGVHMNWPGFPVAQEGAFALRDHIIGVLDKVFPKIPWTQVVDLAVYKGAGFRMPWSHKKSRHGACQGKGCEKCEGGRIIESPYLPVFVFRDGQIEPMDFTEPCVETLVLATVRSDATNPVVITPLEPVPEKPKVRTEEVHDSELSARIQAFVRINFPGQGACEITKVSKNKGSYVCSSKSRFCESVGREHASNHVWFSIDEGGVCQRCHDDGCKQYKSRARIPGTTLMKLLFPDRNATSLVGCMLNGRGGIFDKKASRQHRPSSTV